MSAACSSAITRWSAIVAPACVAPGPSAAALDVDRLQRRAHTGGGWPGATRAGATLGLQRAIAELQGADIVVRDVMRGLVDFPAVRDGEEIYLCWLVDEPEIEHWHELDAGFAGRRRLG